MENCQGWLSQCELTCLSCTWLEQGFTQCVGWSRGLPVQCCLSKAQKSTATSVQGCWPWHVNPLTQVSKALLEVWIWFLEETVMYGFNMLMEAGYWAEIRQPLLVLWLFWRRSNAEVLRFYSAFDSSVSPTAQLDQRSKSPLLSFLCMWKNTPINMKMRKGLPSPRMTPTAFDQLCLTTVPSPFTQKYNTDIWSSPWRGWKYDPSSQTSCWACSSRLPEKGWPSFAKICDSDCVKAHSGETELISSQVNLSEKLNLLL